MELLEYSMYYALYIMSALTENEWGHLSWERSKVTKKVQGRDLDLNLTKRSRSPGDILSMLEYSM